MAAIQSPSEQPDKVAGSADIQVWEAALAQQAGRIRQLEEELQIVYTSKSWRLTAPIRSSRKTVQYAGRGLRGLVRLTRRSQSAFTRRLVRSARQLARTTARRLPPAARARIRRVLNRPPRVYPLPELDELVLASPPEVDERVVGQVRLPLGHPLVSVIVPCFNYGIYLSEAIGSILRQTLSPVEVLVVDDGSTDPHTQAVLDSFERPHTTVLRRPHGGLPSARNIGIAASRGRYICCLDADDRLAATFLEKAVALLESDSGIGFVYSWVQLFGDENDVWRTDRFDLSELRARNFVPVSAVFRREDWAAVGGYAEDMREGYEDWEFWLRLACLGKRGVLIPEPSLQHRLHGRTMIFQARERHDALSETIRTKHPELYVDDQVVSGLARSYSRRPVAPPFLNLQSSHLPGADTSEVLAMVPWLPPGGAEAVLHAVLTGLSCETSIVTSEASRNEWQPRFEKVTRRIYNLPAFLPRDLWEAFVEHLINSLGVRTVLVSGAAFGYELLPLLKERHCGLRTVEILHNASPLGHIARSVRYADSIDCHVVVAGSIAAALTQRGVPESKIRVIPNGIDEEVFNPDRFVRRESQRRWSLVPGRPTVAYVGRMDELKRPLEFLNLAASVADLNVQFVMVGDGPQHDLVARRLGGADLRGRVRWLRAVDPTLVPSILAASDLLVITSKVEGLPIVMLESLSMGVPVFSYDVGDVRSVLTSGVNGVVVPPDDAAALSREVRRYLTRSDYQNALKSSARASLFQGGFTLREMQRAYTSVLLSEAATEQRPLSALAAPGS